MVPVHSAPRIGCRGLENTNANLPAGQKEVGILNPLTLHYATVTVVATILNKSSPYLGIGFSIVTVFRTSGGPYFIHSMAFILKVKAVHQVR